MKIEKKEEAFSRSFEEFKEWMVSMSISKYSIFSATTVDKAFKSFIKSKENENRSKAKRRFKRA